MPAQVTDQTQRGEVLVAIMNNKADFAILQDRGWYRIPVASAPKRWPPKWLGFYQTKIFGEEAYSVNYYGRVGDIQIVRRRQLFPHEPDNPKSDRRYYQIHLSDIEKLPAPIYSRRWRRIVFIPTTWRKFVEAVEINDLYDESPLEDRMWAELKRLKIRAERQWMVQVGKARYLLDFAIFCAHGQVDVETDGDTWHAAKDRISSDNYRNNDLGSRGWHVLRFNGRQIRKSLSEDCVSQIAQTINFLGGLTEEGVAPRVFYQSPDGLRQQLSMFEEGADYDLD